MDFEMLKAIAYEYKALIIEHRNHFHKNPELGFHEEATSSYVKKELTRLGIPFECCEGNYGVIATIQGPEEGKVVGFRADMDALPIQEINEAAYCSQVPGIMHACGHDGHTAVLLGLAAALTEHPELLSGTVKLFFQPAEETPPGGARFMVEQGFADDLDEVYALHFKGEAPVGEVCSTTGPIMANADEITIRIHGKSAHAADPNLAKDALLAGAALVGALQNIVARFINPLDSAVVSISAFHSGGEAHNILQDEAVLLGTVRTFGPEPRALIEQKLHEVCQGICGIYGTTYELDYEKGYPAVINNKAVSERAIAALEKHGFPVTIVRPDLGGEDFAYFLNHTPGFFLYFGCANAEKGIGASVHTPYFDIDEEAFPQALLSELVIYESSAGRI